MDGIGEVEIDGIASAYAIARVAAFLGGTAGHIARHEVTESGITAFKIVITIFFGYVVGLQFTCTDGFGVFLLFWDPDTSVVAQALAHQREFALIVAVDGDAGRVDLHIARIGESGPLAVAHPGCAAVAVHGVGGEVIDVAITTCGNHHGMGGVAFQVASDEVADDDATRPTVDHHEVHHFATGVKFHRATGNLATQGTVGT